MITADHPQWWKTHLHKTCANQTRQFGSKPKSTKSKEASFFLTWFKCYTSAQRETCTEHWLTKTHVNSSYHEAEEFGRITWEVFICIPNSNNLSYKAFKCYLHCLAQQDTLYCTTVVVYTELYKHINEQYLLFWLYFVSWGSLQIANSLIELSRFHFQFFLWYRTADE